MFICYKYQITIYLYFYFKLDVFILIVQRTFQNIFQEEIDSNVRNLSISLSVSSFINLFDCKSASGQTYSPSVFFRGRQSALQPPFQLFHWPNSIMNLCFNCRNMKMRVCHSLANYVNVSANVCLMRNFLVTQPADFKRHLRFIVDLFMSSFRQQNRFRFYFLNIFRIGYWIIEGDLLCKLILFLYF